MPGILRCLVFCLAGITTLIANGVYDSAFPLHDVSCFFLDSFAILSRVRLTWNVFLFDYRETSTPVDKLRGRTTDKYAAIVLHFIQWIRRENVIKFCIFLLPVSAVTWWMGKIRGFLQVSACWSYQVTLRLLWHRALDQRCPNQVLRHRFGPTCQEKTEKACISLCLIYS